MELIVEWQGILPWRAHRRFSVGKSVGRAAHRDSAELLLLSNCRDRSIMIRLQMSLKSKAILFNPLTHRNCGYNLISTVMYLQLFWRPYHNGTHDTYGSVLDDHEQHKQNPCKYPMKMVIILDCVILLLLNSLRRLSRVYAYLSLLSDRFVDICILNEIGGENRMN